MPFRLCMKKDVEETINRDHSTKENNASENKQKHVPWSSRFEFIVTLLGYSLGLGDIWRVPYLTYRNGGGAFLIPYILCMLVCGFPLYYMEIATAQFSGKGSWKVWEMCPLFKGFGIVALIINFYGIVCYPTMRIWIIQYLFNSFKDPLPWSTCLNSWNSDFCVTSTIENSSYVELNITQANATFFRQKNITFHGTKNETLQEKKILSVEEFWNKEVLQLSTSIEDIGPINWKFFLYMLVTHFLVFLSLVKSIKSIGKVVSVTAILPIVLIFIIWIRALMLPGALDGMVYFLKPDFSILIKSKVWMEAAFMAFFTLGPGYGGLATFGCHNKFSENVLADTLTTSFSTLGFGIFNGLVVFSVLGVMSEETGVDISKIITSGGFSLGFVAYPNALTYLPFPQIWSCLFFLALLLPGMDLQTLSVEPIMCICDEAFPRLMKKWRVWVLALIFIVAFALELPFLTRAGAYYFQLIDWYGATWSVFIISWMESIIFIWIYGGPRLSRDIEMMSGRPLPVFIRISCAFITPIALFTLIVISVFTYRQPTYGEYVYPTYANVIGWLLCILGLSPILLWAIKAMLESTGNFLKRLYRVTSPELTWGPADEQCKEWYNETEFGYHRNIKDTFMFNLLGRKGFNSYTHRRHVPLDQIPDTTS